MAISYDSLQSTDVFSSAADIWFPSFVARVFWAAAVVGVLPVSVVGVLPIAVVGVLPAAVVGVLPAAVELDVLLASSYPHVIVSTPDMQQKRLIIVTQVIQIY